MHACVHAKLLQSCPTLCNPMDRSPSGSSLHGIPQSRILEWVAIPFSIWRWVTTIYSVLGSRRCVNHWHTCSLVSIRHTCISPPCKWGPPWLTMGHRTGWQRYGWKSHCPPGWVCSKNQSHQGKPDSSFEKTAAPVFGLSLCCPLWPWAKDWLLWAPCLFPVYRAGASFARLNVYFKAVILIKAGSTLREDILDCDGESGNMGKSHQLITSGPSLHPRRLEWSVDMWPHLWGRTRLLASC